MKRVFITGVSGYFGSKLVEHLGSKDDVGEIIGIDIMKPKRPSAKLTFIRHDVRADMYPLLKDRNIDWAIHAAYILPPIHDKGLMEDININGTRTYFHRASRQAYRSSSSAHTTAYGFHTDNDMPLTEESPLRGDAISLYGQKAGTRGALLAVQGRNIPRSASSLSGRALCRARV